MPPENVFLILLIWSTSLAMGAVSWPASGFLFHRISDRGYSIAKLLGWVVISYAAFVLITFRILPLHIASLIFLFFVWLAFNFWIQLKLHPIKKEAINLNQIFTIEIFFLALLFFWVWVRSHNPAILSIERFMDFGFLNSLFLADSLPLYDIWFLGGYVNYYYFGHFIGYVVLSLSRISPLPGFFVLVAWIFAMLGINVYRLGRDLSSLLFEEIRLRRKSIAGMAGIISFFTVILAGTWHTYLWFFQKLRQLFFNGPEPSFWYPDPTRIIPFTITEMPIYQFLEADLHPHMWGLFSGILVLTTLYALWREQRRGLNFANPYLWLLSFILGISYMINPFDALTLGVLCLIVVFLKFRFLSKKRLLIAAGVIVALSAYLFSLPWSIFYKPPIEGFGIVSSRSPLLPWLSFWGFPLSLTLLFLGRLIQSAQKDKNWHLLFSSQNALHLTIILTVFLFLLFMETFYAKDLFRGGDNFRVNTVFKISNQLWLWLGILSGSIVIWLLFSLKKLKWKAIFLVIFLMIFLGPAIYPVKAIRQAKLENAKPAALSEGLNWWKEKYPEDYEAYLFLEKIKKSLPWNNKVRNLVEAEGESFSDYARFSTFLGWPTIIGWPIHEWTWRGTYDVVAPRVEEVKEIYTGQDRMSTENILSKYKINYIIIGKLERQRYGNKLNLDKLLSLGETIFSNGGTLIIAIKKL